MFEIASAIIFAFPIAVLLYRLDKNMSISDHGILSFVYALVVAVVTIFLGFFGGNVAASFLSGIGSFFGIMVLYWLGYGIGWIVEKV